MPVTPFGPTPIADAEDRYTVPLWAKLLIATALLWFTAFHVVWPAHAASGFVPDPPDCSFSATAIFCDAFLAEDVAGFGAAGIVFRQDTDTDPGNGVANAFVYTGAASVPNPNPYTADVSVGTSTIVDLGDAADWTGMDCDDVRALHVWASDGVTDSAVTTLETPDGACPPTLAAIFGSSPSTPDDPMTQVYDPPTGRIFGSGLLNDYTVRAAVLVGDDEFPDETFQVAFRVKDDADAVVWASPALPFLIADGFICRHPGDCAVHYPVATTQVDYDFPGGETFTIQARSRSLPSGAWGDWSAAVTVTTDDTCDAPDGLAEETLCFLNNAGVWMVQPSAASVAFLQDSATGSFDFGPLTAITESDDEYCPLPDLSDLSIGPIDLGLPDMCASAETVAGYVDDGPWQNALVAAVSVAVLVTIGRFFRLFIAG